MAFKLLARTRETTATTGTGAVVLGGATSQCDVFADGMSNGDTTFAMVVSDDGIAWEEGFYTYVSAGNELTRTAIIRNNTGGTSAITLAGGRVFGMIPADFSLLFDKLFAATRGSITRRGSAAWEALAPGTLGDVLMMGANDPAWAAAAAAGGMFNQTLGATPTSASTGLSTWVNQGSATVADGATGIVLTAPSSAGTNSLVLRTKSAPSTPYKIRALVALNSAFESTGSQHVGIGWSDGTKLLHAFLQNTAPSPSPRLYVFDITAVTSGTFTQRYASSSIFGALPNPIWLIMEDDGTTLKLYVTLDGSDEGKYLLYSIARASSALANFNTIFFGVSPRSSVTIGSLLSWVQY